MIKTDDLLIIEEVIKYLKCKPEWYIFNYLKQLPIEWNEEVVEQIYYFLGGVVFKPRGSEL